VLTLVILDHFFEWCHFTGRDREVARVDNYRYFLQFCFFLSILKKGLMPSKQRGIYFCIYKLDIVSLTDDLSGL